MTVRRLLHIAPCLLLLLLPAFLCACTEEEAVVPAAPARTLTVDLGIALTRAAQGEDIGDDSQPHDLQLWIFDQSGKLLDYAEITDANDLFFSGSDILGEMVNTIQRIIEVEGTVTALNVHVVLNGLNSGLNLGATSTPEQIRTATFSLPPDLSTWGGDNQVPIYGEESLPIAGYQKNYSLTVEAKRAVGKLELLFTKDSESGYLKINSVKLEQMPDKTYLDLEEPAEDISYVENQQNIMEQGDGVEIKTALPADVLIGNFSGYETTNFTSLTLVSDYWLENTKGGTWSETSSQKDYTYPYEDVSVGITDENQRYKMTVLFQTLPDGTQKEQVVYLPAMERNTWTKIFARVKSNGYELQLNVLPWELEEINVDFTDNLSYTSAGWDEETILGYLDGAETRVHLNPYKTAELRFTIQSPATATWRAQLVGADINAFEFVDAHSGNACDAEGNPKEQVIKIKVAEPESDASFEVQLAVFATIGGKDYELDLTNPGSTPIQPGTSGVQRFTLIQSR